MITKGPVTETVRNRLLRRVDFRFLLADPAPKRTICLARGELADAVGLMSETVVAADARSEADCDLAVAATYDRRSLLAAFDALRPGGSVVVEISGRFVDTARIRQRLAEAGFLRPAFYTALRDRSPRFTDLWVPLEGHALRFALGHRKRLPASPARLRRALRDGIRLCSARFRIGEMVYAIAERPGAAAAGGQGIRLGLHDALRSHWQEWGLGDTPGAVSLLLLTTGLRSENKIVALVFTDSDHLPRLAVKMPRVPESITGLAQEAAVLGALERRAPEVGGVPRVLFRGCHGPLPVVGQTVLSGPRLSSLLTSRTAGDLARRATDWQIRLARATSTTQAEDHVGRLVEPVIQDFERNFGAVVDHGLLRAAAERVRAIRTAESVVEQRDFSPWNILVTPSGELGVLDWESSEPEGLPALDLIYFFTYLGIYLDDAYTSRRFTESYLAILSGSSLAGEVTRDGLARYGDVTGIGPAEFHGLRLLTWMLHARSTHRHLSADVGGPPAAERLRGSLFVQLWEAELRSGGHP